MNPAEEQKVIQRVLGGDQSAFEALFLANQKNVYNLALKITANEDDALDISQEAFLKAYAQLGSFRGESRFSVWMYRMTHNLCIDFLRKKSRAKVVSLTYEDDDDVGELEIPDLRSLPENDTIRRELRGTIDESIGELSPKHREILMMREITGLSYEEIGAALGISEGTVKSRLARARQNLATILVKKGTFPDGFRLNKREEADEHE